ncbi:MAG: ABC-2 type transport system permease protein [Candidatus Berkelbacteria bacterium Athens1014_28]|uniref:ABC-2 type transport system permease protein n=1 Tax=Candidatus Berkelbacteria bacterium Athens1014_28 TaxID=2017145 RepID=A0A554LPY5_9BACT|nr:MAG: ABC-2 type transport system permease protein [Candidatus Berkelbacteria bacterium Athens1014_28]
MLSLIARTIRDRRSVMIIYIVAALAFLVMYISIFPAFKDQQAQFDQIIKTMPEGMMKAFNMGDYSLSNFESYISTEEFSLMWPLLLIIMSISFAGQFFAGEVDKGTIEFLLSQPISRAKLFFARYFSGLLMIFAFVTLTVFSTIPIAKMFSVSTQSSHYLSQATIGFLFAWAIYSIAIFLSSLFSEKGKVYFISAGVLVLMYVLNIAAGLKNSLEKLQYLSFFHYYNPSDALIRNHIDKTAVLVFLGVILTFSVLGYMIFNRRDIAT